MEPKPWQRLPDDDLWIKCVFKEDSYSLWLTDLCQLYAEELSVDDFRWRAAKAKIPIDLEEPANLKIVLKTISRAVDENNLTLPKAMGKSRHMDIVAHVQLPKPLPNIEWTFKLELQEDENFREQVSKPLLNRIDGCEQRVDDLVQRLQDKDHTIEKLLDTLDKYSADLADVFPSLASIPGPRRTHTRRDATVHLPALQAFDKEKWEHSMADGKRYERQRGLDRTESKFFEDVPSMDGAEDPREAHSSKPSPSKGIKRTLGTKKASTPVLAASDTESEPAAITAPRAAEANGSVSSLRKDDATREPPKASGGLRAENRVVSPNKPKGIKTNLAGRKKEAEGGDDAAGDAPKADTGSKSSDKTKGINRTLASRRGETTERPPSRERSSKGTTDASLKASPKQTSLPIPVQEEPHDDDEPMMDDEAADKKRAALKRQFAVGPTHRTKKRKF